MSQKKLQSQDKELSSDRMAVPVVHDIFERRFKESVLEKTLGVFSEQEREQLLGQIDNLGTRLDNLIEATYKVREPMSFDVLLIRIMNLITEAFEADRSSLFLYDAESKELYSRIAQGELIHEIRFPCDAGIAGLVFQSGEPALIDNAYTDARFNSSIDAETGYYTHNILCAPLRTRGGDIIGVTEVLNKTSGDFTPADSALLQAFTMHTAAIIEAAQLGERARESQREEARILEVTQAVSSELNIEKLLRRIVAIATDLLEAERSTLFLHDPRTDELWSRVAEGMAEREIRFPAHMGIAGGVFTDRKAVNIPDAYADSRFNPEVDRKTGFRTRSILCVPVVNKHGVAIGAMQILNRRGGPFRARDERRLEMLAAQSAIALDNARLFREVLDERNYSENVLRSLSDGVITLDTAGNVVKLNDAATRQLRIRANDVLGAPAVEVFEHNAWIIESMHKVVSESAVDTTVDAILTTRDGTELSVNVTATPLLDVDGDVLGCTLIIEDITTDRRMRATMARYMTAEVADQVLAEGETVLGGRSQPVTILFSDIKGFTTLTEQLGAQDTVSLLNEYFSEMVEVVFSHHGILDKFIGDAIMAVFGTPFPAPGDADNAVRVAIRMRQVLSALNARRVIAGEPQFEIRIGINSADVVAGNIGSARRMDYTVIGDGVNTAARLESANKQLGTSILVSDSTVKELTGDYRLRELDLIRVKGRAQSVAVFEVRGLGGELVAADEQASMDLFAERLQRYRSRNWGVAIKSFEHALKLNPNDQPSALMCQRARHYQQSGPADDWDGVWTLSEK